MGEHLIAILSERASGELFNDDVCAALDIMMKHGVSLLRNDMKWKPIHNIHTYIRIHDVHVCIQQMRILKIAEIWKVDGMTSTYAELRIAAISSAMVLLSTTLART